MRSSSIASAPVGSNRIELSVELLDRDEVSPFFHEVVVPGDEIELRGSLGGHFTWTAADGGPLLLLVGGSGVVPLVAIIRQGQIFLLLSARRTHDVLYRDELLELERDQHSFRLVLTLTPEPPHRGGNYGRRVDANGGRRAVAPALLAEARIHLRLESVRQRRIGWSGGRRRGPDCHPHRAVRA